MSEPDNEQAIMRNYLLGKLEEPRWEEVEERILCDSGFAERLAIEEDNLIDDYIFNGLSETERESFQKNFLLDDERRHKLKIAQAFEVYVSEGEEGVVHESRVNPWRNAVRIVRRHPIWATFAFSAVLVLVFFFPSIARFISPSPPVLVDQERVRLERQLAELNRHPLVANVQASRELTLQPTRLREGGELEKVVLNKQNQFVKLKLELSAVKYDKYRTIVRTVEGRELFTIDDLEPEPGVSVVALLIPSEFLSTGDYEIDLHGISEDGVSAKLAQYVFRLIQNNEN